MCAVIEYSPNCIFYLCDKLHLCSILCSPLEAVPLQTEAAHPATASLAEVPCFEKWQAQPATVLEL
jgi:hypothetical protein